MMKWIIGIVIVLSLLALLTYKMTHLARLECSLCITFKELRRCTHALGPTNSEALDEAHRSLCAQMASGVTEVLACNRAPREDIQCSQD